METIHFFLHDDMYQLVKGFTGLGTYDFRWPQLNWIWTTYYRLKQKGYENIKLVNKIPDKGIVVMASNQGNVFQKFPKEIFVILTVADSPPWFYSQLNISQNSQQEKDYPNLLRFPVWTHIPHWPQPDLIPRNPERGDRFEKILYMGDRGQLAPELQTEGFFEKVKKLGFQFEIVTRGFNDYSEADVVIAIRNFEKQQMNHKPYSKLVNGWLAGVPVITGNESSFQSVRKSELDFLEAKSEADVLLALRRLKTDIALRKNMVTNGLERGQEFSEAATLARWEDLLFREAQDYYAQWVHKGSQHFYLFRTDLFLSRAFRSLKKRFLSGLNV